MPRYRPISKPVDGTPFLLISISININFNIYNKKRPAII